MPTLAELYARIDAAKAELDGLRPLDREREARVMQKFRLWWTYHSNAIEGNKLTQGETEIFLMEGLTAKGKPLKDHLDLRGHNDAVNFLLSFVKDKRAVTEADIRGLHRILLVEPYPIAAITPEGQPTQKTVAIGEYKTSPNHVKTLTGEIHYYATPEETPARMHELMTWYREEQEKAAMHPVELAARFHHRFTAIHPFDDGNGRMSRLITNLMLMQDGYPPTIIRMNERDAYLAALRNADRDEYDNFIVLVGEHVVESLNLFILAARGKEISEPTDLRKEIALEILRLKHIEEPELRSSANLQALYVGSFDALAKEAANQLLPFCELFTNRSVQIQSDIAQHDGSHRSNSSATKIEDVDLARYYKPFFDSGFMPTATRLEFKFSGFRKGRFDAFDLSASLLITCESLKYTVTGQAQENLPTVLHFYQEALTKDEITSLTEPLARHFLTVIREKTKMV